MEASSTSGISVLPEIQPNAHILQSASDTSQPGFKTEFGTIIQLITISINTNKVIPEND